MLFQAASSSDCDQAVVLLENGLDITEADETDGTEKHAVNITWSQDIVSPAHCVSYATEVCLAM
jgi:hypothetical protein